MSRLNPATKVVIFYDNLLFSNNLFVSLAFADVVILLTGIETREIN